MENQQKATEYGLWLDLPFFFRVVKKWLVAVISLAIVVGCLVYVGSDMFLKDTYTATAVVSVVAKNNSASALSSRNIKSALTRNAAMWNSSALLKAIQDSNPDREVSGTLSAEAVDDTSLVDLTASAHTAEDAYYLLSSAIRTFHQVDSSFDEAYVGVVMTRVTGDSITVSHTHPVLFGIGGFALVVIGCMVLLFLWSCFTDVLHKESQAGEMLAVPLYETLPHINKKKHKIQSVLITQPDCDMDYIEGMDKLTSRVEQHMKAANYKSIMITSIQENEGKTTVAANLALNLARRGRKTLLIDLDFRKPAVYKTFGQEKRTTGGFATVLKNYPAFRMEPETLDDCYGLHFLWQFKAVRDADRLLEQKPFQLLMKKLSEHYEYIVLDTPPVAPVRDSEVAAQYVDCSLLVIRQDFSRAAVANDVSDQLEEHGAPCVGAVLNNCRAYHRTGSKGSGYHYTYNYRMAKGE